MIQRALSAALDQALHFLLADQWQFDLRKLELDLLLYQPQHLLLLTRTLVPSPPDVLLEALQPLLGRTADEVIIGVGVDQRVVLAIDWRCAEIEGLVCEAR